MPITPVPSRNTIFNEDYGIVGEYVNDHELVPYYNPPTSNTLILPGEPNVVQFGPATEERVFFSQGPIWPGDFGMLFNAGKWVADVPAALSADVIFGQELYWDVDNSVAGLVADITNGFSLGFASYALDPNRKNSIPALDGNDRVICGNVSSDRIRIISNNIAAVIKGTVTVL